MHWAKTRSHLPFNLASSGMTNYPLAGLPVTIGELEITGDSYYGYPPLLDAIAKKEGVTPDRIFTTIGTSMANHIAFATLLEPGDEVLIEQPTYELITSTAAYFGVTIRRFPRRPENGFRIDPADIRPLLTSRTRLIVLTNLHNPSSCYTPTDELAAIGDLARTVGARVLVDEVYLDAAFDEPHRCAAHLGPGFLTTNSLTKVYGLSGLRCGWVTGSAEDIKAMWAINDLFNSIPSFPAEQLSVIAFRNLTEIGAVNRRLLEANRESLKAVRESLRGLEGEIPRFGTVWFPRFGEGNAGEFADFLRERYETAVVPGIFFEMPDHLRIGFGGEREMFLQALGRLADALSRFRGKN